MFKREIEVYNEIGLLYSSGRKNEAWGLFNSHPEYFNFIKREQKDFHLHFSKLSKFASWSFPSIFAFGLRNLSWSLLLLNLGCMLVVTLLINFFSSPLVLGVVAVGIVFYVLYFLFYVFGKGISVAKKIIYDRNYDDLMLDYKYKKVNKV